MGLQLFDQQKCGGQLLTTITLKNFGAAVDLWFKSAECIGDYQAYVRGNVNSKNLIIAALTQAFNTRPMGLAHAADRTNLYTRADNYFAQTIQVGAAQQLRTEKQNRKTYWTTGLGAGEFPDFYTYAHQGLGQNHVAHLGTPYQAEGYIRLLGTIIDPFKTATAHNRFNQTYVQATKAAQAINAIRGNVTGFRADDGSMNEGAMQWKTVLECVNYWTKCLEDRAGRLPLTTQLGQTVPNGTGGRLYRLISAGEKDFIVDNGKVAQGPTSFERHKWFFFSTGAPGVGHEWKLEVQLGKNVLDFMFDNAVECGEQQAVSTAAFIKKANEANCIGIHEDLLQPLHAKLSRFVLKKANNTGQAQTVNVQP